MAENTVENDVTTTAPAPAAAGAADTISAAPAADSTRDAARYLTPAVDIQETEAGLTVVADLPGVAAGGAEVRVEDNVLTIRGRVGGATPVAGNAAELYEEYRLHDYFRQFKLNDKIDQERIVARLAHGVLHVELPRAEARKPRQVQVAVG